MTRFSIVLACSVLALACGDDSAPPRSDTGVRDGGEDEGVRRDSGSGDACEGFDEGEGRCESATRTQVCFRGRLVGRTCREGFACVEEDNDAACLCDNVADGFCPERCGDDPDCADCTPSCDGAVCGSDGCGGVCGECGGEELCTDGACEAPSGVCLDTCEFANDGDCDDGGPDSDFDFCDYGTDCGDCGAREELPTICNLNFNDDCAADERCDCEEMTGTCTCNPGVRGTGELGSACSAQHDCQTAVCLDERCSQPCDRGDDCALPLAACQPFLGLCVEGSCTPDCGSRECGDDGCGGSCGTCSGADTCVAGSCEGSVGDGARCPGAPEDCGQGEACCISASDGNPARCFTHGSERDSICRMSAADERYGYVGCDGDEDCIGGQVCCGNANTTFCAESCGPAEGSVCSLSDNDCGADADLRCCPIDTPSWFSGSYGLGRCLALSCP